ncbi:Cytochrome c homolog [Hyphomicrobium sp. 1Nfss2.1]|uniref:c-type cytochrome n=1 Tax=Hyphomicrobium sp. 1Nfss2.1 TaxID=3413936 RepID=UPI003C7C55CF
MLDSFELSKIAGAILCSLLVIVGFRTALEMAAHDKAPEKPGYVLPLPEAAAPPAKGEAAPAEPAAPAFDAKAVADAATSGDAAAGQKVFSKCAACHSGDNGGPNKVGPNLWGVVGRAKASHEGFNYSDAMKAKGGDWTLEDLAHFIHKPKEFVPGTKMLFPGVADTGDLSNLLAYLNTLK